MQEILALQLYPDYYILDNEVININLAKVLVSDSTKDRDFDSSLITEDFNDIANDENIDLVIEVLGGVEPGKRVH